MSAAEVFHAATITAAEAMGLGEKTGLVAAGRTANLVVLEGDATADIANARRCGTWCAVEHHTGGRS